MVRSIFVASMLAVTATSVIAPAASAAPDHILPIVSSPVVRLAYGFGTAFESVAHVTITVMGHDASGMWTYSPPEFRISRNGGPFVPVIVAHTYSVRPDATSVASTSGMVLPRTFALSGTYRVQARMMDRAQNWSHWMTGPLLSPRRILETSANIQYSSGWTHVSDPTPGMSYETASGAGETATLTFTARSVAWLSFLSLDHGSAEVRIDGTLVATVDLARTVEDLGKSGYRRAIFSKTWSTLTKHVLTITVLGTAGHPQVDVGGFLVLV